MANPRNQSSELIDINKQKPIKELYDTEKTYLLALQDQEKALKKLLENPKYGITPEQENKIDYLISLTQSLIRRSNAILQGFTETPARIFCNYTQVMQQIEEKSVSSQEYAIHFKSFINLFSSEDEGWNAEAKKFIGNVNYDNDNMTIISLASLLITPIQREPRYKLMLLMLSEAIKCFDNNSDKIKVINQAFDGISENLEEINQNIKKFEQGNIDCHFKFSVWLNKLSEYENARKNPKLKSEDVKLIHDEMRLARKEFKSALENWFSKIAKIESPTEQTNELYKAVLLKLQFSKISWNRAFDKLPRDDPMRIRLFSICEQLNQMESVLRNAQKTNQCTCKELNELLRAQMDELKTTLAEMPPNIKASISREFQQINDCQVVNRKQLAAYNSANINPIVSANKKAAHEALKLALVAPLKTATICLQAEIDMYKQLLEIKAYNVIKSGSSSTVEAVKSAWERNIQELEKAKNALPRLVNNDDETKFKSAGEILLACKRELRNEIQHTRNQDNKLMSTLNLLTKKIAPDKFNEYLENKARKKEEAEIKQTINQAVFGDNNVKPDSKKH